MLLRVHCIVELSRFTEALFAGTISAKYEGGHNFRESFRNQSFRSYVYFSTRHKPLRKINKTASRQGKSLIYFYAFILGQTNHLCGDVFQLPALIQEHEKIPRVLAPGQRALIVYLMIPWMVTQQKVGYYYDCNEIIFKTVNNLPQLYMLGERCCGVESCIPLALC